MASINLDFDFYGRYQYPDLQLCNPNKHIICNLVNVKGLKFTLRCNDVSEMVFNVYKYFDDIEFDYYSYIRKMRMVHVDGMGYFVIQSVKEKRGEGVPYKEVTCYSAEYMLNYKPVNLAYVTMMTGGTQVYAKSYKFYDAKYPKDTLMYRLFAGADFDDWTFDYSEIDEELAGKYRSFDNTGDGLYGFLQNYVSTAYDCIFTYDIENYKVKVHRKDDLIKPTDIVISFDNLMKSSELEELSDDISTILSVSGSDSLGLSKINPTGTNNIYKLDYYLDEDWIGKSFNVTSIKYDENGDMVMYGSKPATTTMSFEDHVRLWEEQVKKLIYSSNEEGSYAWLLKRYIFLNTQYNITNTFHTYSEYIYNYCTEALTTYQEETKQVKKSAWTSIIVGLGLIAVVAGCVALAAYTGGVTLGALGTALASGGTAVAEALGLSGTAAVVAGAIGTTAVSTGASVAFQGLLQLGAVSYQANVTKDQMKKYQEIAQKNIDTYKSGGDYVYNLTTETITNIVGGKYNEYVADEKLYWVSKTYDSSKETSIYQKTPNDKITDNDVSQIYCLDILNKKLEYIKAKIQWYVDIYAYKNWFSTQEKKVLQPFLIQADYTDESFKATDDIDADTETDMSKSVTTNQGTMTLEEYKSAANDGYYIKYLCRGDGTNPTIDYEATPIKFSITKFREWLVAQNNYVQYKGNEKELNGHFYIYYDGTFWTISAVNDTVVSSDTNVIINQVRGTFPTWLGITQDTHDGKYSYTPKSGDYILLNLYAESLEIIDTITVAMQLAKQAYTILDECSQPAFSFGITCNNFVLLPEYQEWTKQLGFDGKGLTLGSMITVPYESGIVFTPFIQEVSFEYDNPDSLSFTFGNKFNLGTSEYTLGKILSDTTSAAQRSQRSLTASVASEASSYQSGNTIDSLNNTITGNAEEVRADLGKMQKTLDNAYDEIESVNGRLDEYIKKYNIDMSNVDKKFDLVGDTFTYYTPTTEMNSKIEQEKQDTLNKAASDAAAKVEANNQGVIKKWFLEVTGQADKDREAAKKAADNAYNNAVATADAHAKDYDAKQKIVYDQLDQGIKNVLTSGSDALTKANAIINDSLSNWDKVGKLVSGGMGLYCTRIKSGENGGIKMAFHDGTTLSNSKTIWYVTSKGIVFKTGVSGVNENNIDSMAASWGTAISADGSMVMHDIKANRISGDLIAANTIVASSALIPGSITTNLIAANAIVASKIAAGQIYATNLRQDAVFALVWEGSFTSVGATTVTPNKNVTTKAGTTALAHLQNYTAILVYANSDTGNCSCICSDGNASTLIAASNGFSNKQGWWTTHSFVSYVYRSVYLDGSRNVVGFSDAYYMNFTETSTTNAIAVTPHWHSVTPSISWSTANNKCIPQKIYGMMYGV